MKACTGILSVERLTIVSEATSSFIQHYVGTSLVHNFASTSFSNFCQSITYYSNYYTGVWMSLDCNSNKHKHGNITSGWMTFLEYRGGKQVSSYTSLYSAGRSQVHITVLCVCMQVCMQVCIHICMCVLVSMVSQLHDLNEATIPYCFDLLVSNRRTWWRFIITLGTVEGSCKWGLDILHS